MRCSIFIIQYEYILLEQFFLTACVQSVTKNVDPCSMLVPWGIFSYSNNNCTFLTYIRWGEGTEML